MRRCPAARKIMADLAADIAQERYDRTKSHRAYVDLCVKRLRAVKASASPRSVYSRAN